MNGNDFLAVQNIYHIPTFFFFYFSFFPKYQRWAFVFDAAVKLQTETSASHISMLGSSPSDSVSDLAFH